MPSSFDDDFVIYHTCHLRVYSACCSDIFALFSRALPITAATPFARRAVFYALRQRAFA